MFLIACLYFSIMRIRRIIAYEYCLSWSFIFAVSITMVFLLIDYLSGWSFEPGGNLIISAILTGLSVVVIGMGIFMIRVRVFYEAEEVELGK